VVDDEEKVESTWFVSTAPIESDPTSFTLVLEIIGVYLWV